MHHDPPSSRTADLDAGVTTHQVTLGRGVYDATALLVGLVTTALMIQGVLTPWCSFVVVACALVLSPDADD